MKDILEMLWFFFLWISMAVIIVLILAWVIQFLIWAGPVLKIILPPFFRS